MDEVKALKRISAAAAVIAACACVFSTEASRPERAFAEEITAEETQQDSGSSFDTSIYVSRLDEISARQQELKRQLEGADAEILSESEKQRILLEQIAAINEKAQVLNSYVTGLEISISSEQKKVLELKDEVDEGIENYKKRLRAMYIAGDVGYADVLANSGSFFDVLMRTELMKRMTEMDAKRLDELIEKKSQYDSSSQQLLLNENTYDEQMRNLENERAELAAMYNTSGETKQLLREQMEEMTRKERVFENEVYSYEGILNDILFGTYIAEVDEAQRVITEQEATQKLEGLHTQIEERIKAGDKIADDECRYDFGWPVKDHYDITSGIGARWGSYHTGIDISGESAFPISASEAGEVIRTNNSCTHNYGKDGSCGCGGGYGNFVIIDHGNGFLTLYGHLTTTQVEVGDRVTKGQTIGLMGTTGYSTGTHLHFELRYGGYVTNPANFVSF